jgi:chromosome segregation ATPase
MGTSVEDAIKLQKFRLMSLFVQGFESGNIKLARQALNGIEYYATEALVWFEALSKENKSRLAELKEELEGTKEKVNQWREILSDIWGNRGKLGQVIDELAQQSKNLSGFLGKIEGLKGEIAAKIEKLKGNQTEELEELDKELKRLYNLREKVYWLKASLDIAKARFEIIKEEIRAKKKRR